MKLNKNVVAKLNAKSKPGVVQAKKVQPAAAPAAKKTAKAPTSKVTIKSQSRAILLLSGVRGHACRSVELTELSDGKRLVRALQDNKGLVLKDGTPAEIDPKGHLVGKRDGLVELGGYVNGKLKGAKVELLSPAQFHSRSKVANVKWNVDKDAVPGRYIGDPTVKGMLAVEVNGFFWNVEQDSNANNKHERGGVLPPSKNGKLAKVN